MMEHLAIEDRRLAAIADYLEERLSAMLAPTAADLALPRKLDRAARASTDVARRPPP